jgi:NAD(P)-dependent dehydrogenase (short-subunit alcohol dehydrogenase family)
MTALDSKVVLVTGATGGIGFATARRLAELGHRVRLVGRNAQRGDRVVDTIRASTGVDDVRFLAADLSSRASIRDLAARVLAQDDRLDVLLNNVGGLYADRWVTVDGDEATLAMNHHNPLLLTHLLLDRLRASAPSRVVFVTSAGHRMARVRLDDPQAEQFYRGLDTYGTAKLRGVLAATELARRLGGSGVTVHLADPGGAMTDMTSAMQPRMAPPAMRLFWPVLRRVQRGQSVETAAVSSVIAATEPHLDTVTGTYVKPDGRMGAPSRKARDEALAGRVYSDAMRALGIDPVTSHLRGDGRPREGDRPASGR